MRELGSKSQKALERNKLIIYDFENKKMPIESIVEKYDLSIGCIRNILIENGYSSRRKEVNKKLYEH